MKKKTFIALITLLMMPVCVQAESLFSLGASQTYYAEPKSLYASVRARSVGDLITIVMSETISIQDNLNYNTDRTSSTTDNFSELLNAVLPGSPIKKEVNNFGGTNSVESSTKNTRSLAFQDKVTVQAVQLLPNGNLMVQGKKTLINAGERVDLLVSGVVDPRWIDNLGQVSSNNVANLQFALTGKGSVSRGNGEGIVNRIIRYLF